MVVRSQVGVGTQVDGELTVEIRMEMKKNKERNYLFSLLIYTREEPQVSI